MLNKMNGVSGICLGVTIILPITTHMYTLIATPIVLVSMAGVLFKLRKLIDLATEDLENTLAGE